MVEADLDCVLSYYRLFLLSCPSVYVCSPMCSVLWQGMDLVRVRINTGLDSEGNGEEEEEEGERSRRRRLGKRERGIGLYVESTQPAAEAGRGGRSPPSRPHCCRGHGGPAVSFLCSEEEEEEERDRGRVWYVLLLPENSTGGDGFNNFLKSVQRFFHDVLLVYPRVLPSEM